MNAVHDPEALRRRLERLTPRQCNDLAERLRLRAPAAGSTSEGDGRLIAYVVPHNDAELPDFGELRRFLAERLPPFLVPAAFVAADRLPLLPNGKVDRQALAARGAPVPIRRPVIPAANAIEAQLMRIWDDLIDITDIGRNDNFFELGGHSLLVPRLLDRVRRDFDVALPLAAVFQAPTVQALAEVIASKRPAREWRCLVGIRERGPRPPLYMVHGLGGEIGYFYNLAGHLHPDQPVYGLQAPADPFDDLERMASHYLGEIRRHQPHGPYLLGGYCVGGCVAYEMARRLIETGEKVQLLAVVDAVMPGPRPLLTRALRFASKAPRELGPRLTRLLSAPRSQAVATIRTRVRGLGTRLLPRRTPDIPDFVFYGVPQAFQGIAARHYHAQLHYAPQPYSGDMWLFRSRNDEFEPDLGWGPLVGGRLEVREVPGSHADVLKPPHIETTARQIAAALDAALERQG